MTSQQQMALIALYTALHTATACGLLDVLQDDCKSPDSINDVCDAVAFHVGA